VLKRPVHGGNLAWAASIAGCPASLIIDFSASINPLGPPPSVMEAINQGLKALAAYPDPSYYQLRSSLGRWHQLPPEWIFPGNGCAELLTWAGRELSEWEVTYLVTPAFSDYRRALNSFGAEVQECPLDLFTENLSLVAGNKNKGLLLNNPHNPTGKLWKREMILPYLEEFALVVVDESFMDFLPPQEQQSLITTVQDYPNLIILRSLTKFYTLPGLRLGYAISHPQRWQKWQQWRDPWSVNVLAALAAEAVIQDEEFQQQTWDWLFSARAKLFQSLASLPGLKPLPGAANFLLVETEIPSSQVQEKLLKNHQILIRDCLSFPELGDRYFRVAVRTIEDNQRLIEGLKDIYA
jgi:L-threonine-O-3-phosphate decarboxylase